MTTHRTLVWFSCGAASAVAAKRSLEIYPSVTVVYCDTFAGEHPDNRRFFSEVQAWLGVEIQIIRSDRFRDINDVFERTRYMSGIAGARCTTELKKLPREAFQRETDTHVFGYTVEESRRAAAFEDRNPQLTVEWPLIALGITKGDCLREIERAGIALPEMYRLGFEHNNCVGCVKATSPGYWNRTRHLFPDVFAQRAHQSRLIGARLARVKGKRVFLDQLPLTAYAPDDDIECGPVCQSPDTDKGEP